MQGHNPTDLAAQERAKSEQDSAAKVRRDQEKDDFKWLMGHRQGRRFVWRLLSKAGVFRTSFRSDALNMAFLEGQRNLGLLLTSEIHEVCPEREHDMKTENIQDGRRYADNRTK